MLHCYKRLRSDWYHSLKNIPKNKIIKKFYEHGKIEHIFYIANDVIVRIRSFSYDGMESEVPQEYLDKWAYDPTTNTCCINKDAL